MTAIDTTELRAAFVQAQSQIMNEGEFAPVVVISKDLALRLLDELDEQRAEIARHHADFARWEQMADKGAAQLQELAALRSFLGLFGRFIHEDDDSAPLVFVELVQRHDAIVEARS